MDEPAVLVRQIANGSKEAEQALISRFFRPLYAIIVYKCDDPALAQDIVQETLLIVIQKARAREIENPEAIAGFVRRVAENLLLATYRKNKRQRTDSSDEMDLHIHAQNYIENQVGAEKLLEAVTQIISELSVERDRRLLSAYFFEGRDKDELCRTLQLSNEHFDKVLHRAKTRLKQALVVKYNVDLNNQSLLTLLSLAAVLGWLGTYL